MTTVKTEAYNSYILHVTNREEQTLIDNALLRNITRGDVVADLLAAGIVLLNDLTQLANETDLNG